MREAYKPINSGEHRRLLRLLSKTEIKICMCSELWHGPTCAFKDMALPDSAPTCWQKSMRARSAAAKRRRDPGGYLGDTGKAALEGFRMAGTEIMVFYPRTGSAPCRSAR